MAWATDNSGRVVAGAGAVGTGGSFDIVDTIQRDSAVCGVWRVMEQRDPQQNGDGGGRRTSHDDSDAVAFRQLHPTLRRFAVVVAPSDLDPDDLLHDALVNVLRGGPLSRFDSAEAYLKRTMVNLVRNHQRRSSRGRTALRRLGGGQSEAVTPNYPSDLAALMQLDPTDRAVLYLADVEGLSFSAIADITETPEATLRGRASRARRTLRERLRAEQELEEAGQ